MRTLKLVVESDGTDYVGWQRQAEGVWIQGLLEDALAAFEGGPVTVHGAGRTDAGVHALGQVASVTVTAAHDTMPSSADSTRCCHSTSGLSTLQMRRTASTPGSWRARRSTSIEL